MGEDDLDKAYKKIKDVVEKGWKDDAAQSEDPRALLSEATVRVYSEVRNNQKFTDEQRKALEDALDEVKHNIVPNLPESNANIGYINQVGGADNFVKSLMLERAAEKADNPKFMSEILRNGTMMFFHVSGWEQYNDTEKWEQQKRIKQWSRERGER